MTKPNPTELNMTLEGEFVSPPTAPISSRILMWAIIVAVMAGAIALAAFALWIALLILPVAIGAAVLAWGAYRYRMWRGQASLGRQRSVRRR
jgi:hypothetical protein